MWSVRTAAGVPSHSGREGYGSSNAGGSYFGGRDHVIDTAMKPRGPQSSGAADLDLRTGDDVMHNKWGEGVILSIRGNGEKAEAADGKAS